MKLTRIEAEIIIQTAFPDISTMDLRDALDNIERAGMIHDTFKYPQDEQKIVNGYKPHEWKKPDTDEIPEQCKDCSNHPVNGGPGICFCDAIPNVQVQELPQPNSKLVITRKTK